MNASNALRERIAARETRRQRRARAAAARTRRERIALLTRAG